jgi:hypothetical protein
MTSAPLQRIPADPAWFTLFNRDGKGPREVVADAAQPGIALVSRLYDIWNRRERGDLRQPLRQTIGPDEVLFVRYQA